MANLPKRPAKEKRAKNQSRTAVKFLVGIDARRFPGAVTPNSTASLRSPGKWHNIQEPRRAAYRRLSARRVSPILVLRVPFVSPPINICPSLSSVTPSRPLLPSLRCPGLSAIAADVARPLACVYGDRKNAWSESLARSL